MYESNVKFWDMLIDILIIMSVFYIKLEDK